MILSTKEGSVGFCDFLAVWFAHCPFLEGMSTHMAIGIPIFHIG